MDYYCARLFVICLVDGVKPRRRYLCDYPFVIFRARNAEHAMERALALGKEQEHRYKNPKGQWVRWALAEVQHIKRLGKRLDGMEVGSVMDMHRPVQPIPFRKKFRPEKSRPFWD